MASYGYPHVNVAAQRRDPNSILNWMERIIRMRKEVPEIGWGDFSFIPTRSPKVLAMRYEWRDNSVVCVHNLGPEPREVRFHLAVADGQPNVLVNLLSNDHSDADKRWLAPCANGTLWVSVVSRGWLGLLIEAQHSVILGLFVAGRAVHFGGPTERTPIARECHAERV